MNYKILCGMTSFKRPIECIGQIYRFMNMNYDNYKLSVIVRGVDKEVYDSQIIPNVQKFIDSNRLIIKYGQNSNFLVNIIETFDIEEEFDYYAKIDDDDWYSLDYLKEVNEHLNWHPWCCGCHIDPEAIHITYKKDDNIKMRPNETGICGGTFVMNRDIINILIQVKNNLSDIDAILRGHLWPPISIHKGMRQGKNEDALMHRILDYYDENYNMPHITITKPNLYSLYRVYDGVLSR